jgi:hypothetical protein
VACCPAEVCNPDAAILGADGRQLLASRRRTIVHRQFPGHRHLRDFSPAPHGQVKELAAPLRIAFWSPSIIPGIPLLLRVTKDRQAKLEALRSIGIRGLREVHTSVA